MPKFDGSIGSMHYERWAPDGEPNAIVVIVHGYAEYAARYGHVAARLVAGGAVVYGEDHMGHGQSVDYRTSLAAVEAMPSTDKTVCVYEGARHELVNETNRDEVIDEIARFVRRIADAHGAD